MARGEATKESDIDVMVVGSNIKQYREKLSAIRSEIDLEYSTFTTLIYRTPDQLFKGIETGNVFIEEIIRKGKVLYDTGIYQQITSRLLQSIQ